MAVIPIQSPECGCYRVAIYVVVLDCTLYGILKGPSLCCTVAGDVAIEVDDGQSSLAGVTTVVRKGRNGSIKFCIHTVTERFERGGDLFVRFGKRVIKMSKNVLQAIKEGDNEEIKCIYQVKDALYHLGAVVEIAYTFLDKVACIFYYLQGDSMTAAREGLSFSPPDLKSLHDLIGLLGNLSTEAEKIHSKLVDNCKTARSGCSEAAEVCACKERNSQNRKETATVICGTAAGSLMAGGTVAAAGGLVAGGVAISAVAGVFTFGVGAIVGFGITAVVSTAVGVTGVAAGVGTAVATHRTAKRYKESEATFRKIRGDFDDLLGFAYDLNEGVAQVHTTQVNILTHVNNIKDSTDKENIVLIKDTLKHLNEACTDNYSTISTCRRQVKNKMDELNAKLK